MHGSSIALLPMRSRRRRETFRESGVVGTLPESHPTATSVNVPPTCSRVLNGSITSTPVPEKSRLVRVGTARPRELVPLRPLEHRECHGCPPSGDPKLASYQLSSPRAPSRAARISPAVTRDSTNESRISFALP